MTSSPFEVSAEQEALRATVRRFLDRTSSLERVRAVMDGGSPDFSDWATMSKQLGLTAVIIPERWGGAGSSWLEQVVIFEEMGRALFAGPYFSTVAFATSALLLSEDSDAQARYLPKIAAGDLTGTLAFVEADGDWSLSTCATSAKAEGGQWRLHGRKSFVRDGTTAELVLVVAQTDAGLSLFALNGDAPGLSRTRQDTMDKTLHLAELEFDGPSAMLVGTEGEARKILSGTLDYAALAVAADQVGGAQRCLEMSVAYAKIRHQFGRPIGSFQAVKHMCADMLVDVEWARSTVYRAAWDATHNSSEFQAHASVAKAQCSTAYSNVAAATIQVHGGLGFTWEHDAHLFFRRAKSSELFLGDASYHRELFLQRVLA